MLRAVGGLGGVGVGGKKKGKESSMFTFINGSGELPTRKFWMHPQTPKASEMFEFSCHWVWTSRFTILRLCSSVPQFHISAAGSHTFGW